MRHALSVVIAGLDPAIHDETRHTMIYERLSALKFIMDGRVKPGHDSGVVRAFTANSGSSPAMTLWHG
jgi:hypothetical protein